MPSLPKALPSKEVLNTMFLLRDDGRLINKTSRTSRKAGKCADNSLRRGYRTVYVGGKLQFAHRVIWKLLRGADPEFLDHIDGDPLNNKSDNLRACSHAENMRNKRIYANNTSGVKGVHHRKDSGMWRAYISLGGKRVRLGQFTSREEAEAAVSVARDHLHGEFARAA